MEEFIGCCKNGSLVDVQKRLIRDYIDYVDEVCLFTVILLQGALERKDWPDLGFCTESPLDLFFPP
jgi:hypothetical protein